MTGPALCSTFAAYDNAKRVGNLKKMEIRKITEGQKGYFVALDGETEAGRMYFTSAGDDKIIIDHTEVDDAFRGQRVGKRILDEVVRFARGNGIKIIPLCPFAKSVFDKTEEIRDVLF